MAVVTSPSTQIPTGYNLSDYMDGWGYRVKLPCKTLFQAIDCCIRRTYGRTYTG